MSAESVDTADYFYHPKPALKYIGGSFPRPHERLPWQLKLPMRDYKLLMSKLVIPTPHKHKTL